MDAQMQARRAMEYDLRKALAAGEFELHYQPVVNLASNDISGVEALIRWRHPEKGMVPPGAFIPLAEEIGFIVPLGEWAIREACATAAQLAGRHHGSPSTSRRRSSAIRASCRSWSSALAASGLAAERLELEITESIAAAGQRGDARHAVSSCATLGVRIAMDDFGTGYSSLSYLQSFPFDKIKIDRSFVKDIADGAGSLNIVRAVAAMANGLGMTTTAEGVETKEQLDSGPRRGLHRDAGLPVQPAPAAQRARAAAVVGQRGRSSRRARGVSEMASGQS